MCGIVGYIGHKKAQPVLLKCLERLEYRGYDSCGIAVSEGDVKVYKDMVRVGALRKLLPQLNERIGIGHTRWATHGEPSKVNAHPHIDCKGKVAVVHNGIINNYQTLKRKLSDEGHHFVSETDTEVIPHLIEKYYNGSLDGAVEAALGDLEGSYAIIATAAGEDKLVVARKDSPLIIGIGDGESFIASDVPAMLDYTNRVVYLEDGEVGIVGPEGVEVKRDGKRFLRESERVWWNIEDAQKGGYEHFMLKEIHEQPKVIRDTIGEYVSSVEPIADLALPLDTTRVDMLLLACGTSYHAALIAKYLIEELDRIPVRVELASEFNYGWTPVKTEAIVITQSGETADTIKAIKRLKETGCRVVAITNVVGSTASRVADQVIYTRAGPEISVAATKSFVAQLMALYWLVLSYSKIDIRKLDSLIMELRQLPSKIEQVLQNKGRIGECAEYLSKYRDVFFIARGRNFPVALEGSLKLKEVSYIHAEGYSAGELKHGPFALLSQSTPVVAIVASDNTCEAMLTNIKEVKARGASVIAVAEEGDALSGEITDFLISVPKIDPIFSPVLNTVVVQLLSYYAARCLGCPIDFPRNLAKSVTVE